jgi:hypothetical protein
MDPGPAQALPGGVAAMVTSGESLPTSALGDASKDGAQGEAQALGESYHERWEHMLVGVAASEFGLKRRLSKTPPTELRRRVWENRSLMVPLLTHPLDKLKEACPPPHQLRPFDAALLRSMLSEILIWCAPATEGACRGCPQCWR